MTRKPSIGDRPVPAAAADSVETVSGAATQAWQHLVAAGVADRAQAIRRLATYPQRWDLTSHDVTVILDRYPVMAWGSPTNELYLRLVGEITPGGLPAVLAAVPDQWWVSPDAPAMDGNDSLQKTLADPVRCHPDSGDRRAVEAGVEAALLILSAQGLITNRNPQADPSAPTAAEPGAIPGRRPAAAPADEEITR